MRKKGGSILKKWRKLSSTTTQTRLISTYPIYISSSRHFSPKKKFKTDEKWPQPRQSIHSRLCVDPDRKNSNKYKKTIYTKNETLPLPVLQSQHNYFSYFLHIHKIPEQIILHSMDQAAANLSKLSVKDNIPRRTRIGPLLEDETLDKSERKSWIGPLIRNRMSPNAA